MNKLSHYILENTNQVNRNTDWLNQTKSSLSMKLCKVIIVFFLVLTASQSFAQRDEITTQAGEKIRCRILDETPNRFIYAYLSPTGKVLRNEIFKNLVSDFKYNIYPSDIVTKGNKLPEGIGEAREENSASTQRVDTRKSDSSKSKEEAKKSSKKNEIKAKPDENVAANESSSKKTEPSNDVDKKNKKSQEKKSTPQKEKVAEQKNEKKVKEEEAEMPLSTKKTDNEFSNYLKWRIGGRGGFGNMLAKIPIENDYSLYKEKLLRGFTWGADAAYFFTDHIGLGMMFNNFKSQNKAENIDYNNEILNVVVKGNVTNKRSTKFVGPVLYYRKNIDFKTMVVLGVSPGVYFYNDKGTYDDASYTFKGMDFGASATLGIDFLLGNDITGRDIILSLETGYSYGKMRALDFGAGGGAINLATPIDLSRLDFTIGLRFTRYPRYFR
ncbi:porin family protein [Emticicia aquatica]|nr:porin family protein [Emticicia aquatica]